MNTTTPKQTDVTIRWRLAGWVPPSEQEGYQAKCKEFRESMPTRWVDYVTKTVQIKAPA
jgi:hypothetical protein